MEPLNIRMLIDNIRLDYRIYVVRHKKNETVPVTLSI